MTLEILIQSNSIADLKDKEVQAIADFGTKSPNGYNLTNGGDGVWGLKRTPETVANDRIRGINQWACEKFKAKHKNAMAIAMQDPNVRSGISAALRAKWQDPSFREKCTNSRIGKKQSEETKRKRAKSIRASWFSGAKVQPGSYSTDEISKVYAMKGCMTAKDAASKTGMTPSYVAGVWRHEKAKVALAALGIYEVE